MSKDTFYSLVPLNWLLRGTALSHIHRNGIHIRESGSVTKSTIFIISFGILNSFCLYLKIIKIQASKQTGLVTFSDSVQLTYWLSYLEYIADVYFVYKYGRLRLLKYLRDFDNIDNILGNPSYANIRRIITHTVLLSVVIFFFNSIFDHVCWTLVEGWKSATIYSVDYLYFLLNMLTVLDTISHVIQVEYRLKMIGDLLQDCNIVTSFNELDNADVKNNSITGPVTVNNKSEPLDSLKLLNNRKYLESIWFSRCYLMLLEQVAYINVSHGFRALVYCVNLLINMINMLNLAIRVVNGTLQIAHPCGPLTYLPSASSTLRALNYCVMIIILVYRCEQAYKQSSRILESIDKVLTTKNNCNILKTNLIEFRSLLVTRPIKFTAAKFFIIDYTLLVSLSSVVVTYTIIMLQSIQ